MVLSIVHGAIPAITYPILFAAGVVLAVVSLAAVLSDYRDPDAVVDDRNTVSTSRTAR